MDNLGDERAHTRTHTHTAHLGDERDGLGGWGGQVRAARCAAGSPPDLYVCETSTLFGPCLGLNTPCLGLVWALFRPKHTLFGPCLGLNTPCLGIV